MSNLPNAFKSLKGEGGAFGREDRSMMSEEAVETLAGPRQTLRLGMWIAWSLFALYIAYEASLFAGGVAQGVPVDPFMAIAEVLDIIGALLQVILIATIYECAPRRAKSLTRIALGWMLVMAGLTVSVHFVMLTVGRQIDVATFPGYARVFGWEWPSLLYAVELAAWHLFFSLSLLFAASAFRGHGRQALVRAGLRVTGVLCIAGLVGPAVGNLNWRMIGVFGYGVVFPLVCVAIALVFKHATASEEVLPQAGR
jgi:hypothetical protein